MEVKPEKNARVAIPGDRTASAGTISKQSDQQKRRKKGGLLFSLKKEKVSVLRDELFNPRQLGAICQLL